MPFTIKDHMIRDVPTIESSVSVTKAAKDMSKLGKGFLIVLKKGQPAGVVTEYDFVNKVLAKELDPTKVSVGEVMSSPIISVDPDEDLLKAGEIMRENNIRRLPVIKNGIIYGIIDAKDVATHCGSYVDQATRDLIKWMGAFKTLPF